MTDGRDPTRLTVIASIALLCAGALILIVMTLVGSDSHGTGARALGTALTAVFFLLLATSGATLSRSRADLAWFGYLTAIVSLGALVGTVSAIWSHPDSGTGRAIGVAAVLALAGAHASLLLMPRFRDGGQKLLRLRNATLAMLAVLAVVIVDAIASDSQLISGKALAILVILYVLGAMVLPIAQRSQLRGTSLPSAPDSGGSAADLLQAGGYSLVEGPQRLDPAHAAGERIRLRDPDGGLVDLITYDR